MTRMKTAGTLSDSDRSALEVVHRQGATHRERQRAQAILLSSRGYGLDQLADILGSALVSGAAEGRASAPASTRNASGVFARAFRYLFSR